MTLSALICTTLAYVLLVLAACTALTRGDWRRILAVAALSTALLLVLPVQGVSLAAQFRGVLGELSITSMGLLLLATLTFWRPSCALPLPALRRLRWAIVLGGLVLYPTALGLGNVDMYALGWRPAELTALLTVALMWGYRRGEGWVWLVLAALIAYNLQLLSSTNLWDYLLDPWLWLWAVALELRHGFAYWRRGGARA
jgi:hypothetical protein